MNNVAYISFERDMEDYWFRMKEPTGRSDTWWECRNAVAHCKEMGWRAEWVGDEYYKPKDFPVLPKESN